MRIYYRSPDLVITDEAFILLAAPRRTYLIRELHQVGMIRGELDPARSSSAHVAGGALVLVVAGWPMLDNVAAYAAAALIVALPGAASIACWRLKPRHWELRATYENREVVLYSSADVRIFNQVGRGLRRAIEDSRPSASWYGLAGG
jgi:hypothetical protein